MKKPISVIVLAALPIAFAAARLMAKAALEDQLGYLFPAAESFSDKQGMPPHYEAYGHGALRRRSRPRPLVRRRSGSVRS